MVVIIPTVPYFGNLVFSGNRVAPPLNSPSQQLNITSQDRTQGMEPSLSERDQLENLAANSHSEERIRAAWPEFLAQTKIEGPQPQK
jgi:hypothetical protein